MFDRKMFNIVLRKDLKRVQLIKTICKHTRVVCGVQFVQFWFDHWKWIGV